MSGQTARVLIFVSFPATDPDLVESYAHRALTLEAPHGWDCPCLICADARVAIGHVEAVMDPWDLLGVEWIA